MVNWILSTTPDLEHLFTRNNPAGIYLLKVNNRNTRARCEICFKLTIKTPERRHWRLYCQLLTLHTLF